jgi:hypothetical protein
VFEYRVRNPIRLFMDLRAWPKGNNLRLGMRESWKSLDAVLLSMT